jgi:ribosomal-protein-alanine N-acetyltransferase
MNHSLLFSSVPRLSGPRLHTKAIDHGDDAMFVAILTNPECFRYTPGSHRKTVQAAKNVIDHYARDFLKKSTVMIGLYETASETLIGILEVFDIQRKDDSVEIGYRLHPSCWRQGYGTEGLTLLTRYLTETIGVATVKATAMVENEASNRLLEKCGYRRIRTSMQETVWKDKGPVHLNHYVFRF